MSLRLLLAMLTAGPLVVTVCVTAWLSLRSGEALVAGVVQDLQHEVAAGAVSAVRQTLAPPHLLNGLNQDLLTTGVLSATDHDELQRVFYRQLHSFPTVGYVQLGTADGHFVGVERVAQGFRVERTDARLTGKTVWALDENGERRGEPLEEVVGYQTTTRPWYRAGAAATGPTWSPIYQFSSQKKVRLGITAVQPWRVDGQVRGVLGADIVLSQLGEQLEAAHLREGGRLFLVERNGDLVAHSTVQPPFRIDEDRIAQRLPASEAPDPLTVVTAKALAPDLATLEDPVYREIPFDGDLAYVFATPVRDGRGIDWIAVVALPRGDFTPELRANTTRTLWLVVFASLCAIGLGAVAWRWVGGPILQLADAAVGLTKGVQLPLPRSRMAEVARLSDAFAYMRAELDRRQDAVERARDEAVVARRTAEEASRAKSAFLASMSHELRTPLTAILGYSELLREEADPSTTAQGDIDRILASGRHLLGIVSDVLDLSRIEAGFVDLDLAEIDVSEVVRDAAHQLRGLVQKNGNRLEVQASEAIVLVTDEQKLRQCLMNLVSNAAKYTVDGRVRVKVVRGGEFAHIEVADTGVGIPQEKLLTVFEPFAQVGGATQRSGTGLGLAITREYARALGGDVTVRSKVGVGTAFTLSLPLRPPA